MPVGFGFSAGDFIAALKLVGIVTDALRDSGEASSEYRELLRELHSLETALLLVKRLDGEEIPQSEIISLQQAAAQCQSTIDDFWKKAQKYQPFLGSYYSPSRVKCGWMRVKWALCRKDDLVKFKAKLVGHTESINIILNAIQLSQMAIHDRKQDHHHHTLAGMIQKAYFRSMHRLCSITDGVTRLWIQGKELRQMIERVLRTNIEVFKVVLQIQSIITQIPGQIEGSRPVYLIDALGKRRHFHLDFIPSAEAFISALKFQVKGIRRAPEKIDRGEFVIRDTTLKTDIDLSQEWERCFSPGQTVDMSMIFHRGRALDDVTACPSCGSQDPDCSGEEAVCCTCGLIFSQYKKTSADPVAELEGPPRTLERANGNNYTLAGPEPSRLNPLKRKRSEDTFEDVRLFHRVRIYTSMRSEEVSIMLATNIVATVLPVNGGTHYGSGECFLLEDEDDVVEQGASKRVICSIAADAIHDAYIIPGESGFFSHDSNGEELGLSFESSEKCTEIWNLIQSCRPKSNEMIEKPYVILRHSFSYWSVLEQIYFPILVDYFGHDWIGISHFIETKTSSMVKNHFVREILNGKSWLEDRAQAAEERKSRGEPPGFQLHPIQRISTGSTIRPISFD